MTVSTVYNRVVFQDIWRGNCALKGAPANGTYNNRISLVPKATVLICRSLFPPSWKTQEYCKLGRSFLVKAGTMSEGSKYYTTDEWRELRRQTFERDGYTCQRCGFFGKEKVGSKQRKLTAHHINIRNRGGADALDNLITLCVNCHSIVHHEMNAG